jgi:hypothetical protein
MPRRASPVVDVPCTRHVRAAPISTCADALPTRSLRVTFGGQPPARGRAPATARIANAGFDVLEQQRVPREVTRGNDAFVMVLHEVLTSRAVDGISERIQLSPLISRTQSHRAETRRKTVRIPRSLCGGALRNLPAFLWRVVGAWCAVAMPPVHSNLQTCEFDLYGDPKQLVFR